MYLYNNHLSFILKKKRYVKVSSVTIVHNKTVWRKYWILCLIIKHRCYSDGYYLDHSQLPFPAGVNLSASGTGEAGF